MPWTPAQHRLFAAIEHGWKPPSSSGIHIPVATATKMAHEGIKRKRGGLATLAPDSVQERGVGGVINRVARLFQRPLTRPSFAAEATSSEPLSIEQARARFALARDSARSEGADELADLPVEEGHGVWLDDKGNVQQNPLFMQRLPRHLGPVEGSPDLPYAAHMGQAMDQHAVPVARAIPDLIDTPDGSNALIAHNINAGAMSKLAKSLGQDAVIAQQPGGKALIFSLKDEPIAQLRQRVGDAAPELSLRYGVSDPGIDRTLIGDVDYADQPYSKLAPNPRTPLYSALERKLFGEPNLQDEFGSASAVPHDLGY